jgi:hypothetical protein
MHFMLLAKGFDKLNDSNYEPTVKVTVRPYCKYERPGMKLLSRSPTTAMAFLKTLSIKSFNPSLLPNQPDKEQDLV